MQFVRDNRDHYDVELCEEGLLKAFPGLKKEDLAPGKRVLITISEVL